MESLGGGAGRSQRRIRDAFVGREAELRLLRTALADACRGGLRVAVISGEAGAGKTRLVERFLDDVAVESHWSRCHEALATPPFWPWSELLESLLARASDGGPPRDGLRSAFAPLLPDMTVGDGRDRVGSGSDEVLFLFSAVRRALAETIAEPVVLVVDDMQWADPDSLSLLRFLTREAGELPCLLLLTTRGVSGDDGGPHAGLVAYLASQRHYERIDLAGFDTSAIAELAADALGATPSAEAIEALSSATAGNPFFVSHLLEQLACVGRAEEADLIELMSSLPAAIVDTIRRHVATLSSSGATDLLETAAVVGDSFSPRQLAEMLSRDVGEVLSWL